MRDKTFDWFDWFIGIKILFVALLLMWVSHLLIDIFMSNLDILSIMIQSTVVFMRVMGNLILVLLVATTTLSIVTIVMLITRR